MMDYEMFKEIAKEKFKNFLGMEVEVRLVYKVNRSLDSIFVRDPKAGTQASQVLYLNDMYEQYRKTEDLEETLSSAADVMEQALLEDFGFEKGLDYEKAGENIIFQLINTEQNRVLLSGVPHRAFEDLSIIYRWVVGEGRDEITTGVINNFIAEQLGMSETDLFKAATENTKRMMPPTVRSMGKVMADMLAKEGMPSEIAEMVADGMPEHMQTCYVISNKKGINGAASMIYEDVLHQLAEKLGDDLYILPSSVHEVIAVRAAMGNPEEFAQMVAEVNMSCVSLGERLSNQVYLYDRELKKLSIATDTGNKQLDGIVARTGLI